MVALLGNRAKTVSRLQSSAVAARVDCRAARRWIVAGVCRSTVGLTWGAERNGALLGDAVVLRAVRRVNEAAACGRAEAGTVFESETVAAVVDLVAAGRDCHAAVCLRAEDFTLSTDERQTNLVHAVPSRLSAVRRVEGARVGCGAPEAVRNESQAFAASVPSCAARRNSNALLCGRAEDLS